MKLRLNLDKSIQEKVHLAAIIISVLLLLSAGVAYLEFSRMSDYVSTFIAKNVECINSSNDLIELCEGFNQDILKNDDTILKRVNDANMIDAQFQNYISLISTNITVDSENHYVDSVRYAYAAYMQVVNRVEDMWFEDYSDKVSWYKESVETIYLKLEGYLQTLSSLSQNILSSNYDELSDRYYRSIMPAVLAIGASIVIVLLFIYFLNIFVLSPLMKIHAGLKDYKEFNRVYNVSFDSGGDQIQEINEMVQEIVEENKRLNSRHSFKYIDKDTDEL